MPNTIFIALQCCQCSIMQVKQMKKSSNKWTCVVCNHKQSVRKVFAQGYMAKDLRQFVQSFNMSRALRESEQRDECESEIELEMPIKKPKLNNYATTDSREEDDELHNPAVFNSQGQVGENEPGEHEQTRSCAMSKWSIYMTPEEDKEAMTGQATMSMAASKWSKTCQPKETNAVSKWSSYMTQDDTKPVPRTCQATMTFAAAKWSNYMDTRICQPKMTPAATVRSNYMTKGDKEPRARQTTTVKAASKWSEDMTGDKYQRNDLPIAGTALSKWHSYLTQDEDELLTVNNRKFADHIVDWSNGVLETTTHDQKVEDDIHPDFI